MAHDADERDVFQPVDTQTFNYAIVAVGIVILYSVGFWVLSARKWFTGPVKQIEGENLETQTRTVIDAMLL